MERTFVFVAICSFAMALIGCKKEPEAANPNAIFAAASWRLSHSPIPPSTECSQENSRRQPANVEISSEAVEEQWKEALQGKWVATGAMYGLSPGNGIRYYTFHGDQLTIDWEANFEQKAETRKFRIVVTTFPPRLITNGPHPFFCIPSLYPSNGENESQCVEVMQFDRDLLWIDLCSNESIASGHDFRSGTCFRQVRD